MRIALLQLLPAGSAEENRAKGEAYCRLAKKEGADIALFPEMWSCGYSFPQEIGALRASAVAADGEFLSSFGRLAQELNMAIGITFLEKYSPSPRNSFCLFDRHGRCVLHYAKVHTCDFGEERCLTAGEAFPVAELDTADGTVKVGAMICYDREFPESARILMLNGAEVILVPNACPMEINRLSQLRARAFENMCAVVTVNYPAGQPDCNGRSSVFDGIAYLPGEEEPRDTCLLEAPAEEGLYFADLDLRVLRAYRRSEVHGNAYRRPECYKKLTDRSVAEPFIRSDRRKHD